MRVPTTAALLAAAVVACAPRPPAGPAPPDALAYWVPAPNPSTYVFADTATFSVHAGVLGDMTVTAAHAGMAELTFRPDGDRLEVEARIQRLSGSLDAPPGGAAEVDEGDVDGPFLIALDLRGRTELVEVPWMSPLLRDITGPEALMRPLFVHLPGEVVEVGAVWTDTITSVSDDADTRIRSEAVVTTTLAGDTVVGGRRLVTLHTLAENRIETTGRSGGAVITQVLEGTTAGTVLWDPWRRLLVERVEEGGLSGSLTLPGTDAPIPVTATVRRRVSGEGRGQ